MPPAHNAIEPAAAPKPATTAIAASVSGIAIAVSLHYRGSNHSVAITAVGHGPAPHTLFYSEYSG
jgi:hypothetical protein